jgi:small basic protein (TIGR04137 family)
MSIHRSFRSSSTMEKHRNVLSRMERIIRMGKLGRWDEDAQSVFNLPKLRNIKVRGKKKAAEEETAVDAAAGTEAAAAPVAAPVPEKKAAAEKKPAGKSAKK